MEVPLRPGKKPLKQAKKLKTKFSKVTLSQVKTYIVFPHNALSIYDVTHTVALLICK